MRMRLDLFLFILQLTEYHVIVCQGSAHGEEARHGECNVLSRTLGWRVAEYSVPVYVRQGKDWHAKKKGTMASYSNGLLLPEERTHCAVQFSVHKSGMLLFVGPGHVSPQFLPLQVGIYTRIRRKKRPSMLLLVSFSK
jgi:hypothetical protein